MRMAELHADLDGIGPDKELQLQLKLEGILQMLEDARIDMRRARSDEDLRTWSEDSQALLSKAIEALKPLAGY